MYFWLRWVFICWRVSFPLVAVSQYSCLENPVFLPGESQEWRSLVGCRLRARTESDTTEVI